MMIPDAEAAVVQFLLANQALGALIGANRVSTEVPPEAQLPRVRVTLTGGSVTVQRWLYAPRITIEGWAEDKATARRVAETALVELQQGLPAAQVAEGIVTSCDLDSGLLWAPDENTQLARYLGSVTVYIHPNPQGETEE
jgi:hypothetical protein